MYLRLSALDFHLMGLFHRKTRWQRSTFMSLDDSDSFLPHSFAGVPNCVHIGSEDQSGVCQLLDDDDDCFVFKADKLPPRTS